MKKFLDFSIRKLQRMDSTKPLMESSNNDIDDVTDHERERPGERRISQELRSVCADGASHDVYFSSVTCEANSEPLSFPDPPEDLEEHLDWHLKTVDQILKHSHPTSGDERLCQTRSHLDVLLQNISKTKNCSILISWVSQRKQILDKPDLGLLDEWESKAEEKLMESVKEELRDSLEKILETDQRQTVDSEEAYVQLYVDIIQCISAMPKLVQNISSTLRLKVQNVCFQELDCYAKRYSFEQTKILGLKAQTWRENVENPETIHFLKTLRTCRELREHIKGYDMRSNLFKETKTTLEATETMILVLLKRVVTELSQLCLKDHFKSRKPGRESLLSSKPQERQYELFASLKNHFPKLPNASVEQKIVMDEVYKVVVQSYLKQLLQKSHRTLKKEWHPDVAKAVGEDADQLHAIISDVAPDVQQWNHLLLTIQEVMQCKTLDAVKITIATLPRDLVEKSEEQEFLPKLLKWKGLSKHQVREVLEALPDSPATTRSGSLFSCFRCCS